jgi:hypothetical protein
LAVAADKQQRFQVVDAFHSKKALGAMFDLEAPRATLKEDQCFLTYFQDAEQVRRYFLKGDDLYESEIDQSETAMAKSIEDYLALLSSLASTSTVASDLSKTLFAGLDLTACRQLIVVPDRALHYLVFEELVEHVSPATVVYYTASLRGLLVSRASKDQFKSSSIYTESDAAEDFLLEKELNFTKSLFPAHGTDVIVDLRQEVLTAATPAAGAAVIHYQKSMSYLPRGELYFGSHKSVGSYAQLGEEIAGVASALQAKDYVAGMISLWQHNRVVAALYTKHLQRGLAAGQRFETTLIEVRKKIRTLYDHPSAWGSVRPYIYDLSLVEQAAH